MLNSLRSLSERDAIIDGESNDAKALEPILQDAETVKFVLRSSKGIVKTADGRSTTIEPKADNAAYAVVTDFRLLYLLGSDAEDRTIDTELDLGDVTCRKTRSGLLNTALVAVAGDIEVKFIPSSGPDLDAVVDYTDRVGSAWSDFESAIAAARNYTDAFEENLRAGENGSDALTEARSRISNAHHHAILHDDGPVEAMQAMIESVETELDRLQVETRLERVDDLVADAEAEDSFDDAVELLVEADDHLDDARDAIDGDAAIEPVEERATAIDELAASLLANTEDYCLRALEVDDAATAATAWETAIQRYWTLTATDWDGLAGVGNEAIEFQLAWVVGRRIDALIDFAAELEARGDDLDEAGDDATASYERAKAQIEAARALAEEYPHTDADRFDGRLDDLQEKIDVSEWQWGNA